MRAEQRSFPRIKVLLETVYYSEMPDEVREQKRVYFPGTVVNSSRYGLGMQVHHPHKPLEQLWFGDISTDGRPVTGLVQWVSNEERDLYNIGIRLFHPAS